MANVTKFYGMKIVHSGVLPLACMKCMPARLHFQAPRMNGFGCIGEKRFFLKIINFEIEKNAIISKTVVDMKKNYRIKYVQIEKLPTR